MGSYVVCPTCLDKRRAGVNNDRTGALELIVNTFCAAPRKDAFCRKHRYDILPCASRGQAWSPRGWALALEVGVGDPAPELAPEPVPARQQRCARGRAGWTDVGICDMRSLAMQAVEIGLPQSRMPVARHVALGIVVGEREDDAGPRPAMPSEPQAHPADAHDSRTHATTCASAGGGGGKVRPRIIRKPGRSRCRRRPRTVCLGYGTLG